MNEAALLTARDNGNVIDDRAIDEAIDRVMAGPQRTSRIMSEHERKVTAYHEGGHALVAAALRNIRAGYQDYDSAAWPCTGLHDGNAAGR